MDNCTCCGQLATSMGNDGPICMDCWEAGYGRDEAEQPNRPAHLPPEVFKEIVAALAHRDGAFDTSVDQLNINGVTVHCSPV